MNITIKSTQSKSSFSGSKYRQRRPELAKFIGLMLLMILVTDGYAYGYVGPGAGFAVVGTFFIMFTAILSAFLALLTWPIRYLIRWIKGRKAFARSRVKKFVILGLDGMDHHLATKFIAQGKLPNFKKLQDQGCFKPLHTTVPSISPVAWSSFQTGVNPGKHNIFDFLTRDKHTYMPKLSSVDIHGPSKTLKIGKYQFALGKPDIRLLRKAIPFWKILGEHGIFSNVLRVPITFPPEKFYGVSLSGMCVPDLRGTQGMFSYYTTNTNGDGEHTGGERFIVQRDGDTIKSEIIGSENPMRTDRSLLKIPFEITIKDETNAKIKLNGDEYDLVRDKYTDWIQLKFNAAPGVKVNGICKFLLIGTELEFELYVTPINIDPEKPVMPITHPPVFSTYLAKKQGSFATLGLAEDSWALNEKVLVDEGFIEQCIGMDKEREAMFFDSLDKVRHGCCVCVFDGTDRIQHTFWRDIDEDHPARDQNSEGRNAITDLYKRMDDLVGRVYEKCKGDDTVFMIISDHGFNSFRRGVDLNRWLEQEGYLKVKEEKRGEKYLTSIDWSQTKAFGIGLTGMFLNIKGRESQGIVEDGEEAAKLRDEIQEKLSKLVDPDTGDSAVLNVYNALKVYRGPYKGEAPDLIVGYNKGYRASWETAIGEVTESVFHDNTKAWSGDHCMDPSLVPGVLFCNRKIDTDRCRLMDIGPTVLDMFGVDIPAHMDGKNLAVNDSEKKESKKES